MPIFKFSSKTRDSYRFFDKQSEYQPFFEAFDGEEADDEDKGDNIKQVEQQDTSGIDGADGAGKPDRMRQRNNLGEGPNISGQI